MNPFHSSPQLQLFLQQLPPATWSRPMILKRSKLQPGDIPPPLSEAKSSLPADIQQQVRRQPLPESEELFIQSGPGNECERKCYSTAQFVDSSRYTKRYSRKAISPPSPIILYPSRLSSRWGQHLETNG